MAQPTQNQITSLFNDYILSGPRQSNGAYLDALLLAALMQASNEYQIGISDALDIYTGFLIRDDVRKRLSLPALVPDSTSTTDSQLAFVGRTIEIYQEQNP